MALAVWIYGKEDDTVTRKRNDIFGKYGKSKQQNNFTYKKNSTSITFPLNHFHPISSKGMGYLRLSIYLNYNLWTFDVIAIN